VLTMNTKIKDFFGALISRKDESFYSAS